MGRRAAAAGLTANQVTTAGTLAVVASSCAYFAAGSSPLSALAFGLGIAAFEETDNLDGAIARATGTATKHGAYLDAFTDRYKDLAVLGAIAAVHDLWPLAFLAASGGLLTSYAKARAGMEAPFSNRDWPDLFERTERIVTVVIGLIAQGLFGSGGWLLTVTPLGLEPIAWALALLALGAHGTALQRGIRAYGRLRRIDRGPDA